MQIDDTLTIHSDSEVVLNGGSVNIGDAPASPVAADTLRVGPNGSLLGDEAQITGNVLLDGGIGGAPRSSWGSFSFGQSPGTFTIDGDLIMTEQSILEIDVDGIGAGQIDMLEVLGDVTIQGEIVFNFGYSPSEGDTIEFMVANSADLDSPTYTINYLAPGFEFDTSFDGATLMMVALNDGFLIPEPSTFTLALVGLLMLSCHGRRGRRR